MTLSALDVVLEREPRLDDVEYWARLYEKQPASVTVTRTDSSDCQQRQLVISLDGECLGDLLFGHAIARDVAPGAHTLRVHNTLVWKTLTFDVTPGQQIRFEAINRMGFMTVPLMWILGVGPLYVTVRRVT
jgi:hypothetical protein